MKRRTPHSRLVTLCEASTTDELLNTADSKPFNFAASLDMHVCPQKVGLNAACQVGLHHKRRDRHLVEHGAERERSYSWSTYSCGSWSLHRCVTSKSLATHSA